MQSLRNRLIAVVAVGVLWLIGSLMNFRQASAQGPGGPGGLNVNVASPIPLPVSVNGSATVSGTVAVSNVPLPVSGAVAVSNLPLPVLLTATTTVLADKAAYCFRI
jgi:hypothetical protein